MSWEIYLKESYVIILLILLISLLLQLLRMVEDFVYIQAKAFTVFVQNESTIFDMI